MQFCAFLEILKGGDFYFYVENSSSCTWLYFIFFQIFLKVLNENEII